MPYIRPRSQNEVPMYSLPGARNMNEENVEADYHSAGICELEDWALGARGQ